jgi:hypothetical protein
VTNFTTSIADAIFRDKVLTARRQTPSEKFAICFELFEQSIETMRSGIIGQHPEFGVEAVNTELERRLRIRRSIEERGIYSPIEAREEPLSS